MLLKKYLIVYNKRYNISQYNSITKKSYLKWQIWWYIGPNTVIVLFNSIFPMLLILNFLVVCHNTLVKSSIAYYDVCNHKLQNIRMWWCPYEHSRLTWEAKEKEKKIQETLQPCLCLTPIVQSCRWRIWLTSPLEDDCTHSSNKDRVSVSWLVDPT